MVNERDTEIPDPPITERSPESQVVGKRTLVFTKSGQEMEADATLEEIAFFQSKQEEASWQGIMTPIRIMASWPGSQHRFPFPVTEIDLELTRSREIQREYAMAHGA